MLIRGLLRHNDIWEPRLKAAASQAPLGQWELSYSLLVELTFVLKNLTQEWGGMARSERTNFLRRGIVSSRFLSCVTQCLAKK